MGYLKRDLSAPTRWLLIALSLIVVLILVRVIYNIISHRTSLKNFPTVPVVTAKAVAEDFPVYILALGSVTPTDTVTVRTQVNGQLLRVLFEEGQTVKASQVLAQIDPRPYQAQLLQYEGQLARDQALLANAKLDLQRYQTLYKQDSVAQQTLDTQKSLVNQYEGAVKFDLGQIQVIRVNLSFTDITAPIDGRIGLRLVDPGNFVQTTDTKGLVVITRMHPITVVFSIPEDKVPIVTEQLRAGKTLTAEVYDRSETFKLATGTLLSMDNQIDLSTGTVKLRAIFKNEEDRLFPNQFVNIKLLVDTLQEAILIPTAAVQRGEKGPFVFLVNHDNTVNIKPISIRETSAEKVAVLGDIHPGNILVIEGAEKLNEGTKIVISNKVKTP